MEKLWCSSCKKETKQRIDYKDSILNPIEIFRRGSSESIWTVGCEKIFISTCLGCDVKNLNIQRVHIGPKGSIVVNKKEHEKIIPKNWIFEIENESIFKLLLEVYNAINQDLNRLAVMGIRSLIDYYLNNAVGDMGGFAKKLKEAKNKSILSEQQYKILSSVIEVGHSVTHRKGVIEQKDIIQLLNVIEGIFYQDISLGKLKQIESRIPKRL